MTPKEKAEQIWSEMYVIHFPLGAERDLRMFIGSDDERMEGIVKGAKEKAKNDAKKYADVCVNEIRKALLAQYNNHYSEDTQHEIGFWCNSDECKFWTDVKDEIENL